MQASGEKNRKGNKKEFKIILMVRGQIHSRPELCLGISPLFLTFPEVFPQSNDQEADNVHVYPIHPLPCQPSRSHQWHTANVQTTLCFWRSWPPFWRCQEPFYITAVSDVPWLHIWDTLLHLDTTPLPNHGASRTWMGRGCISAFSPGWGQPENFSMATTSLHFNSNIKSRARDLTRNLFTVCVCPQHIIPLIHAKSEFTESSKKQDNPRVTCSDLFLPWQSQSPKERYLPSHGQFTTSGGTVALHHDFIGILLQGFVLLTRRTDTSTAKGSAGLFNII